MLQKTVKNAITHFTVMSLLKTDLCNYVYNRNVLLTNDHKTNQKKPALTRVQRPMLEMFS